MARPSAGSGVSSWCCADALSCSARRALRSTAASSRPSTRATGTSRRPRCSGGWSQIAREHARYLSQLDSARLARGKPVPEAKITRLNDEDRSAAPGDKVACNGLNTQMMQTEDKQMIAELIPMLARWLPAVEAAEMVRWLMCERAARSRKYHLIVTHRDDQIVGSRPSRAIPHVCAGTRSDWYWRLVRGCSRSRCATAPRKLSTSRASFGITAVICRSR